MPMEDQVEFCHPTQVSWSPEIPKLIRKDFIYTHDAQPNTFSLAATVKILA